MTDDVEENESDEEGNYLELGHDGTHVFEKHL